MKKKHGRTIKQTIQPTLTGKVFLLAMGDFFMTAIVGTLGAVMDGFIIGQTKELVEIGAISLTAPLFFILAMIWSLLSAGGNLLCRKQLAQGKIEKARDIASETLLFGLGIATLCTFGLFMFSGVFAQVLGAAPGMEIFKPCRDYLIGTAIGIPAMAGIGLSSSFLQMTGKRRWFVYSIAVMCITNTSLDLIAHHLFYGNMVMQMATEVSYTSSLKLNNLTIRI